MSGVDDVMGSRVMSGVDDVMGSKYVKVVVMFSGYTCGLLKSLPTPSKERKKSIAYHHLLCAPHEHTVFDLLLPYNAHPPFTQLDINTVVAGGGSMLFFGSGLFAVGPDSAGANPGPICYSKGKWTPHTCDLSCDWSCDLLLQQADS